MKPLIIFSFVVLDNIGDIAVLTSGMDLKTLLNTWKVFSKLTVVYEISLKKLGSTKCVTRRYADLIKEICQLLSDSFKVIQFIMIVL